MKIKPQGLYSVKEASKFLNITERYAQITAKRLGIQKIDNRYLFWGHQLLELSSKRTERSAELKRTKKRIDADVIRLIAEIDNDEYIKEVLTAVKQGNRLEEMTEEEYEQFVERLRLANRLEERINEYKEEITRMESYVQDYRQNVEYLKKSLDKQQQQTDIILNSIQQRNYIEAKEKGIDE